MSVLLVSLQRRSRTVGATALNRNTSHDKVKKWFSGSISCNEKVNLVFFFI